MRMTRLATALGLCLAGASGAVQAQDWSGFYGGLSLGRGVGDMDYGADGSFDGDFEGNVVGLFVGYNLQSGSMVYGGELAYAESSVADEALPEEAFESFLDLKGRVGYTTGPALYYGVLGYSYDTYFRDGASIESTGDGVAYGFGAEFLVSNKFFIGAEVLRRDLNNDANSDYIELDSVIDTFSLRLGMSF